MRDLIGSSPSASFQRAGVQKTEVWTSRTDRKWGTGVSTQGSRGDSSRLELGGEDPSTPEKEQDTSPVQPALQQEAGRSPALRMESCCEQVALGRLAGPSLQQLPLPLFREGSFKGMLMIPTKSSVGTRERRMDLIRMASPFPVWISCKVGLESKINEVPTLLLQKPGAVKWFSLSGGWGGYTSMFP